MRWIDEEEQVLLTWEEDSEFTPLWKAGWGSRRPLAWTGCSLDIRALARLMMSLMRWMKPSFSDGRMYSLCTWTTQGQWKRHSDRRHD